MHMTAHIKTNSIAHRNLTGRGALSTVIDGVTFTFLRHVGRYIADPLTPAQGEALGRHQHVQLELMGVAPEASQAVAEAALPANGGLEGEGVEEPATDDAPQTETAPTTAQNTSKKKR